MDAEGKRPGLAVSVMAVAASGGMWYLAGSVHHVFALAWLAPVPLLVLLPDLSLPQGALAAYAMARTAAQGLLTVSDGAGRVVAQRSSADASNVELVSPVALGPGPYLLRRGGDGFAWLCVAFFVLLPVARWRGFSVPRNHRPRG